jgi:hypothetical protein
VRVRAARETEPEGEPLIGSAGVVVVVGGGVDAGVSHIPTPP